MPRDIIAEQNFSSSQNRMPVDILQAAKKSTAASDMPNVLRRGLQDVGAGLGKTIYSLGEEIPYHFLSKLIPPALRPSLPYTSSQVEQGLMPKNPNWLDKLAAGVGEYGLFGVGEAPEGILANMGEQAARGGMFGSIQDEKAPAFGLAEGALAGGLTGGLTAPLSIGVGKLLQKGFSKISPSTYAKSIVQDLGAGQDLPTNDKLLAKAIHNAFLQRENESDALYSPIFSRAATSGKDLGSIDSNYLKIHPSDLERIKNKPDLRDLHNQFIKNPSFSNAHQLQSDLGLEIRRLTSKGLNRSSTEDNELQSYLKGREALNQDIYKYLDSISSPSDKLPLGSLRNQYAFAQTNYFNNMAPYLMHPGISKIAQGIETYPNNISSMFARPHDYHLKIADDIGPEATNKILYSELGKHRLNTPEKLLNKSADLKEKGMDEYFTPELNQKLENLENIKNLRKWLEMGGGALLGYHLFPHSDLGVALGGLGAYTVPRLGAALQKIIPKKGVAKKEVRGLLGQQLRNLPSGITVPLATSVNRQSY